MAGRMRKYFWSGSSIEEKSIIILGSLRGGEGEALSSRSVLIILLGGSGIISQWGGSTW